MHSIFWRCADEVKAVRTFFLLSLNTIHVCLMDDTARSIYAAQWFKTSFTDMGPFEGASTNWATAPRQKLKNLFTRNWKEGDKLKQCLLKDGFVNIFSQSLIPMKIFDQQNFLDLDFGATSSPPPINESKVNKSTFERFLFNKRLVASFVISLLNQFEQTGTTKLVSWTQPDIWKQWSVHKSAVQNNILKHT